jgi:nucleoid DNA-binding protein
MATRKTSSKTRSTKAASKRVAPKSSASKANVTKLEPKMPTPAAVAEAAPVQGVTLESTAPKLVSTVITKKDMFERLKARVPAVKGSDIRLVMDALLNELGDALAAGEGIKNAELGNLRVVKQKKAENADILTLKLRRKKVTEDAQEALEPSGE